VLVVLQVGARLCQQCTIDAWYTYVSVSVLCLVSGFWFLFFSCTVYIPCPSCLTQESYVGEDRLGRTLAIAEINRLAVVALSILVQIDQQLKYILLTWCAGISQFRFIVAVDRIHVRTDNGNGYVVSKIVHVSAISNQ